MIIMMASRNDIKGRLIHNQSPFPTKDKVLSYTIPIDHTEPLLFCSSSSDSNGTCGAGSGAKNGAGISSQDNESLNFIGPDDDPCTGRDSLASFLDEGLGTSLDGVDEVTSPIFSSLGRNDSGAFSSDEGTGGGVVGKVGASTENTSSSSNSSSSTHNHTGSPLSSRDTSVADVVCWKGSSPGRNGDVDGISRSPSAEATIPIVTVSTGVNGDLETTVVHPTTKYIISSENGRDSDVAGEESTLKLYAHQPDNEAIDFNGETQEEEQLSGSSSRKGNSQHHHQHHQRSKNMPIGRQGPQKCSICEKAFSNASALTKHKLTHSDERRHACATCGKAFKRQDHLNGHMLTHRNKKPFECKSKGCGKSYCDARSLRRHVENRHGHEFLESMNLSSHKHSKKHNGCGHHNNGTMKSQQSHEKYQHQQEPQQEVVQFIPVKVEYPESTDSSDGKEHDSMQEAEPLEAKPQIQVEANNKKDKSSKGSEIGTPSNPNLQPMSVQEAGPPILEKMDEASPCFPLPTARDGVPTVVKRENISVFDFDESLEDTSALPYNTPGAPTFCVPSSAPQLLPQEKLPPVAPVVKINNIMDPSKLGPDLKLIQEWARRLGDSKVALFLSSATSSTGGSSIAQFSGPLQLSGGTVTSGTSHAFIPTSENGIFSVTPISIVPTSSNEFSLKRADIIMTSDSAESGKPFYILPTQQLLSSAPIPSAPTTSPINVNVNIHEPSKVQPPKVMHSTNEPKSKSEPSKGKTKSTGIGTALANRIKTKLKAGSLKKMGKGNGESKGEHGHSTKHSKQKCPVSIVNDTPVLSEMGNGDGDTHGDLMLLPMHSTPHPDIVGPTGCTNRDHTHGGVVGWCESPKDCLMHAMEEDRLSDGGVDGDEKPVECSICCRRFKNTPALNGHMRLHGGYFKKETEGSKKKEVSSKDNNHGTPLQTVSVSVRALIEEKIKERRNNLLKLAAAAAAEKAANEQGGTTPAEPTPSSPTLGSLPSYSNHEKQKPDKSSVDKTRAVEHKATTSSPNIAQKVQESISQLNKASTKHANPKLNPELTSEKDRNCDHLINDSRRSKLTKTISKPIIISNNNNSSSTATAITTSSVNLDVSFQDQNILMGGSSANNIGLGGGVIETSPPQSSLGAITNNCSDFAMQPQVLLRDSMQSQPVNNGELAFPFQMLDKSNFTLLDCGIQPDQSGHAFHIIYVDNNGESIPLTVTPGGVGKVGDMFPASNTKISELPQTGSYNEASDFSNIKGIKDALMGCPPSSQSQLGDDPCTPLWEWKSSISSDNTDSSFGIPQDCVNSFFGSSSSDTPADSCSKDPVAAGRGYCYTPILSPNSSFCLTPGPDSPFDVSSQNQSLSFLCPSPTMGDGPIFSYSSVPSLVNPSSSEEPIFSPDPPQSTPTTPLNISPTSEAQSCFQFQPSQPQPLPQQKLQDSLFINEFETSQCQSQTKDGIISMSHTAPIQSPYMTDQQGSMKNESVLMDCLPPITTFPTMVNNTALAAAAAAANHNENEKFENFPNYNLVYQCPIDNILGSNLMQQQQTFIPFEVFTSTPIPSRVADKWISGKTGKSNKINVGPEYQAELPKLIEPVKGKGKRGRSLDEKLWDPHVIHSSTVDEVENYLEFACCSAVPGGGTNKEYALHLLMLSKGNIREALLRLMEKIPTLPPKLRNYSYAENQRWSSEEIISFQIALFQVGKDFPRIAKSIGTKSKEECASFYYFWKKVCGSQYNVMKQIWKGRLEHQQLQLSQQNANIFDLINNSNNASFHNNACSGV